MKESESNNLQAKYDKAGDDLRLKLVEFAQLPEFQNLLTEAYYMWQNDPDFIGDLISEDELDDQTFSKFYDWFLHDFRLFDTKETIIKKYYKESDDLTELEKKLLGDWVESTCSFYEVNEIIDDSSCFLTDIFTDQLLKIKDKNLANNIKPTDIINGRPLKTGSNYYFSDLISIYPRAFKPTLLDIFKSEFEEYKETYGQDQTASSYIKNWGYLIGSYIEDIIKHPQYMTREGEEFVISTSKYKLSNQSEVVIKLQQIESLNEVKTNSKKIKAFYWEEVDNKNLGANIEISNKTLTLVCNSENNLKLAKKTLESTLANLIQHKKDEIRKLDSFIDTKNKKSNIKLKLPLGVKTKKELNTSLEEYYSNWIDMPIEKLDGKTPREALKTKAGRKNLEEILKELENLYENARKAGEPYFEIDKLRKQILDISKTE